MSNPTDQKPRFWRTPHYTGEGLGPSCHSKLPVVAEKPITVIPVAEEQFRAHLKGVDADLEDLFLEGWPVFTPVVEQGFAAVLWDAATGPNQVAVVLVDETCIDDLEALYPVAEEHHWLTEFRERYGPIWRDRFVPAEHPEVVRQRAEDRKEADYASAAEQFLTQSEELTLDGLIPPVDVRRLQSICVARGKDLEARAMLGYSGLRWRYGVGGPDTGGSQVRPTPRGLEFHNLWEPEREAALRAEAGLVLDDPADYGEPPWVLIDLGIAAMVRLPEDYRGCLYVTPTGMALREPTPEEREAWRARQAAQEDPPGEDAKPASEEG